MKRSESSAAGDPIPFAPLGAAPEVGPPTPVEIVLGIVTLAVLALAIATFFR